MRDYRVELCRCGEIIIRANSATEAAVMAGRFGFDSVHWNDNCEMFVEEADSEHQNGSKIVKVEGVKYAKSGKKNKLKKRKQRYYPNEFPEEIPF